jgi:hypothetical protein|tara:strand:+ start:81 stop:680 length:600 start_codon:yes stop_codon:yes gene_type:complete
MAEECNCSQEHDKAESLVEEKPQEEKKAEADDKEAEDKNKAVLDSLATSMKSVAESITSVSNTMKSLDARIKALETPTDLPLTPKVSDKDDIGAEVKVPNTYQSNSIQAGLHDDKTGEEKPEGDKDNLSMQEKSYLPEAQSFTTETPRPTANITKSVSSQGSTLNPVLKAARSRGNQYMDVLAREILSGKFGTEEGVNY